MKIVAFVHAITSCWNNGHAHFLRGVFRELARSGHDVLICEPADGWSRENLTRDHGDIADDMFGFFFPELAVHRYEGSPDLEMLLDGADLVLVHEWNPPDLIAALGQARRRAGFTLLFHDTHHRAVSDPASLKRCDLSGYDGVLAFGAVLAAIYEREGWGRRAFIWHEAADVRLFHPPVSETARTGVVFIGNWGDDERGAELTEYLLRPTRDAGCGLAVHGVRYPTQALDTLRAHGARYLGWVANCSAPSVFARSLATIHVPRRYYAQTLPGIPTIRVFEALAAGIPLLSAPWEDSEGLFRPGSDYLVARDGAEMTRKLRSVLADPNLRDALVRSGRETILARHTCAHRAAELLAIAADLRQALREAV